MSRNQVISRFGAVILAALAVSCNAQAQPQPTSVAPPAHLKSPEVSGDKVTFHLFAPDANRVMLEGVWTDGGHVAMTKGGDGVWSTTVTLAPEFYAYWFVVDGVNVLDPLNPEVGRGGSHYRNMLVVSASKPGLLDFQDVPHGTVEQIWYPSPTLHMPERRMNVYLPPSYQQDRTKKFPVLYLLHGGGGDDEDAWSAWGRATVIMDNLIASGKAVPMIVVMPNGLNAESAAVGYGFGPTPSPNQNASPLPQVGGNTQPVNPPQGPLPTYAGAYPESLVKDVIPFVEKTYRVQADRAHRAIAGLSMGSAQTFVIANNNPTVFDYIGTFSGGGPLDVDTSYGAQLDAIKKANIKLYWTGAGDIDMARDRTRALHAALKARGIPTSYKEIPGWHTWWLWRDFLADYASELFKDTSVATN